MSSVLQGIARWAVALSALCTAACASHSERMEPIRTALDEGHPEEAIRLLGDAMGVQNQADLPRDFGSDNSLFLLDRGSLQQSVARFAASKRDFEAADKAVDMLDLAHDTGDTIGEYALSGSGGKYQAPPYEKLLVNTLDMVNYLEERDLNGARIESRRLAVMQKYVTDALGEPDNTVLGLGALLAGFTAEKSDEPDEALRWYDEALRFHGFGAVRPAVRALLGRGSYRSPRLREIEADGAVPPSLEDGNEGEILFVIGYGRVPHKVAERIPIGLALTYFSGALSPNNVSLANQIAAQGLVTWINYPTLGREQGSYALPAAALDSGYVQLEQAVDVTREVRGEWKKIEGKVIVSAITRMVTRFAAGAAVKAASGREGLLGTLLSIGTQATLSAFDTPDTRSWETLPARVAVGRVRVPVGAHVVHLDVRGVHRDISVNVERGGWTLVSLMALR